MAYDNSGTYGKGGGAPGNRIVVENSMSQRYEKARCRLDGIRFHVHVDCKGSVMSVGRCKDVFVEHLKYARNNIDQKKRMLSTRAQTGRMAMHLESPFYAYRRSKIRDYFRRVNRRRRET